MCSENDLKQSEIARSPITIAPITRLSDDILRYIFELHCQDWLSMSLLVTLPLKGLFGRRTPPQVTLSHVCLSWREILLDCPTFWDNIRVLPTFLDVYQTESTVKVANTLLSRAQGLPCSIAFAFANDDDDWSDYKNRTMDWHKNIVRDLISLHKFKRLDVTFADHHIQEFLQLPDDKLSCIEDLNIRLVNTREDGFSNSASSWDMHKLSSLTSFSLSPTPFKYHSPSGDPSQGCSKFVRIPWHNLRHINLHPTVSVPFCLNALSCSSSVLETCSFVINGDHSFARSPRVEPIHFSRLRDLKVVVDISFDYENIEGELILESFLLSLRFPTLKSLSLGFSGHTMSVELQTLFRVQNASEMELEELIISDSALSIDVRALLIGFPSLRCLELPDAITFPDNVILEVGEGSIGTFLEDLTIKDRNLDLDKLFQMVKARSRASVQGSQSQIEATGFKSVNFYSNLAENQLETETWNTFEEIREMGVDLQVNVRDSLDVERERTKRFWDYIEEFSYGEATDGDFVW